MGQCLVVRSQQVETCSVCAALSGDARLMLTSGRVFPLDWLGTACFFTKLDLTKGYCQILSQGVNRLVVRVIMSWDALSPSVQGSIA